MGVLRVAVVIGILLTVSPAHAAIITIDQLPAGFAGALATPGRQIIGGEPSINFNIATDVFALDEAEFGVSQVLFANSLTGGLPASGVNVIVVQDAGMAAGTAATAIAAQLTTPGAGFFVYFTANLQLPRLVFSADLDDPTADLAILARLPNLGGPAGFAAMPTFTAANFTITQVPEPATTLLVGIALAGAALRRRSRNGRP